MISKAVKTLLWKAYLLKDALLKKKIYTELKNIAKSFEEDIFIKFQEKGILRASVDIRDSYFKIYDDTGEWAEGVFSVPFSPDAKKFFQEIRVAKMELDTALESNQITDILRDVYAMRKNPAALTSGYEAYCAVTRFLPDSGLLSIRYHYCELDYSKAVRSLARASGVKGHRIFFRNAPRYGMAAGLFVMAIGFLYPFLPRQLSIIFSIMLGIGAGFITFLAFQVIGSLEYDKEYLEKRLKEKT